MNTSSVTSNTQDSYISVPFYGADLYLINHDDQPYTPMKTIVDGMGLTWQPQHRKLLANSSKWGITELVIPSAGGPQSATCLLLRKLPGWLMSIEPGKVKDPAVRDRVIRYQNECDDVLWKYWTEGTAVNPRKEYAINSDDTLTKPQQDILRNLIETSARRLPKEKQGKAIMGAWSRLKSHFKVSYRNIPQMEFTEAVSIVQRTTVAWELMDDEVLCLKGQQSIDVQELLLAGQSEPTISVPPDLLKEIDDRAWEMSGEAFQLARIFLLRRVAYCAVAGYPRALDPKRVTACIREVDLGRALTHKYYDQLKTYEGLLDAAKDQIERSLADLKMSFH